MSNGGFKIPRMRPMFSYFGSKHRLAAKYPRPLYDTVIEPFAGSACYALKYPERKVILYDLNENVCRLWEYLIGVEEAEIRSLPVDGFTDIRDLDISAGAKLLLGFWVVKGSGTPRDKAPGGWKGKNPHSFWGKSVRAHVARSLKNIRHWKVVNDTYENIPDREATWFVDPPYQNKCGRFYTHNKIDFPRLGDWCESRKGQVIACEQAGADWLPFRPFRSVKNVGNGKSVEVIWTNGVGPRRGGLGLS